MNLKVLTEVTLKKLQKIIFKNLNCAISVQKRRTGPRKATRSNFLIFHRSQLSHTSSQVQRGIGLAQCPNTPTQKLSRCAVGRSQSSLRGTEPMPLLRCCSLPLCWEEPPCQGACSLEGAWPKVITSKSSAPTPLAQLQDPHLWEGNHALPSFPSFWNIYFCTLNTC